VKFQTESDGSEKDNFAFRRAHKRMQRKEGSEDQRQTGRLEMVMIAQALTPVRGSTNGWSRTVKENRFRNEELHPIYRLKRYLSPQIAEVVLNCPDEDSLWESHRKEVTIVVVDLRGFTSFADSVEPEEVMVLLRNYHAEMGRLVFKFQGTLERFTGDGIMAYFDSFTPCEHHTKEAVRMALEMRDRGKELRAGWLKKGYDLDVGIGLAAGYATVGSFGFEGRMDYGAVGKVTNLTYRLCEEADGGQILTNQKTLSKIEDFVHAEPMETLQLKGIARPITAFNILALR
jgi:adenylate cyclase